MEQLKTEIFGGTAPAIFFFWMVIAGVSQYLTIYFKSRSKYRKSGNDTPLHFSWAFMTQDNLQKLVVGFFIAYLGLRGSAIFFQDAASFAVAVGIGPGAEVIASFFAKTEAKARE